MAKASAVEPAHRAAAASAQQHRLPDPAQPLPNAHVEAVVGYFAMLGEPTRVRLLWALREGELGVTALAQAAACTPTAASQHLAKLRLAGLVDQRAEGRARLYRLRGTHIRRLLEEALGHAEHALAGIPHDA